MSLLAPLYQWEKEALTRVMELSGWARISIKQLRVQSPCFLHYTTLTSGLNLISTPITFNLSHPYITSLCQGNPGGSWTLWSISTHRKPIDDPTQLPKLGKIPVFVYITGAQMSQRLSPKTQSYSDVDLGCYLLCFLQGPSGWTMSTALVGRPALQPAPPTAGGSPTANTRKMWAWCAARRGFLGSSLTIHWSTT